MGYPSSRSSVFSSEVLIDLGADPWQMNGSGFTALDYARDMETAQFLYDLMEGDKLSDKAQFQGRDLVEFRLDGL